MDNFDLKKYLAEGKLYQPSNLNENLEQDILDFWNQLQDDAEESNGEYEAEWDTIFFIEQYPEHTAHSLLHSWLLTENHCLHYPEVRRPLVRGRWKNFRLS